MLPIAPHFSISQLADLGAAKAILLSVGLRAVVNPLYECGETIELVRPRDPSLALWLFSATASEQIIVADAGTGDGWVAANVTTAAEMVAAIESGSAVCV